MKKFFTGFAVLLASVSLAACSMFQGESIDGEWTSPTAAETFMTEAMAESDSEEMFTYTDHTFSEVVTGATVDLSVADDEAVLNMSMMVDREAFFTALSEEYKAALDQSLTDVGLTYDELDDASKALYDESIPSDEELYELIDQTFELMATGMNGTYDAEAGVITAEMFSGTVDRTAEAIELTSINSAGGVSLEDGDAQSYTYEDGVLTLVGAEDNEDMVFEKAE